MCLAEIACHVTREPVFGQVNYDVRAVDPIPAVAAYARATAEPVLARLNAVISVESCLRHFSR